MLPWNGAPTPAGPGRCRELAGPFVLLIALTRRCESGEPTSIESGHSGCRFQSCERDARRAQKAYCAGAAAIALARARPVATEILSFQRNTLPYLRLLFHGITESQELRAFDAAGIDHLSVKRDGSLDVVVQCKGFSVTPAEVGDGQAKQCLASIKKFRGAGRKASGYRILHNRDHPNPSFFEPVQETLADLCQDELVNWSALWSPEDLLDHVDEEMVHRFTMEVTRSSALAIEEATAILATRIIETVPFVHAKHMAHGGTLKPLSPREARMANPWRGCKPIAAKSLY